MGMKQGKKLQKRSGVRHDAPDGKALAALVAKAFPKDVEGALAALLDVMGGGSLTDDDTDDAALDADDDDDVDADAGKKNVDMDARMDALTKEVEANRARAIAAEKALERQSKSTTEGLSRAIADHQAASDRARLAGVRLDAATLTPAQMDKQTLCALYPEDKEEILKYSDVETAAHIRQAFHAKHGDARIRGARSNVGLDSFPAIPRDDKGKDVWAEEEAADRAFNGQARRS